MKIAHVLWGLTYGGIETMLVNISNEQAKLGAEISVIIINDKVETELLEKLDEKIRVVKIDRKRQSLGSGFVIRIHKVLDELKPDIIHLHWSETRNFINRRRARRSHVVATMHALPKGKVGMAWRWGRMIERMVGMNPGNVCALNQVDHVFSISQVVADELSKKYGISSDVVYNGIVTSNFLRRDSHIPQDTIQIVQVGRLEYDIKGQDLLIEAATILKKDYNTIVYLTFIGDGPSLSYLQELVTQKGIEQQVSFWGSRSQDYVAQHLKDYDLFVQPSRYEGFGLTVAEAMAAGLPVLVSNNQGPAEVTEGNHYGWIFENGSAKDLAEKILFLIGNYSDALKKAELAHQHVCANYCVNVTAQTYMKHYENIIKKGCKRPKLGYGQIWLR